MARIPSSQNIQRATPNPPALPTGGAGNVQPIVNAWAEGVERTTAAAGNSLTQLADAVGNAHNRIQQKNAEIDRVRKVDGVREQVFNEFNALQTRDLSDEKNIEAFTEMMRDLENSTVSDHEYDRSSQERLRASLSDIRFQYTQKAVALGMTAKKHAANDSLAKSLDQSIGILKTEGFTAQAMIDHHNRGREAVNGLLFNLDENERRDWLNDWDSAGVVFTANRMIDNSDIAGAEEFLMSESVRGTIPRAEQGKLWSRIHSTRKAALEARKNALKPVVVNGNLVSFDPSTGQANVVYSGPAENEKPFGTGVRAGTLDVFRHLAGKYEGGQTTEAEDKLFETAVTDYTQVKRDPETGLETHNILPDFVKSALDARGRGDLAERKFEVGTGAVTRAIQRATGGKTMWDLADEGNLTGPIPTLGRLVSRFPGIGVASPEMNRAETFVNVMKRDLVRALQKSKFFAVREMEAIERDVDVGSAVFDSAPAYKARAIGVADALEIHLARARQLIDAPDTPADDRRAARRAKEAIDAFLNVLLPPRLYSREEAVTFSATHPPGTLVLYRQDGKWVPKETAKPKKTE